MLPYLYEKVLMIIKLAEIFVVLFVSLDNYNCFENFSTVLFVLQSTIQLGSFI